ncbi:MAG TPA: nucleotide sugar dehydrogenase [Anaerolineae bacterium]|nr:nucleotide sugar dehydrogenase [Anaerolineae bacterium]
MRKVCVLGLGYIGLPTAAMFATHGLQVVGVDINGSVVDMLNNGEIHIEEVGLRALVREAMVSGRLAVQSAPERSDAFIIAVPTPVRADKAADMRAVTAAAESIVPHLCRDNLVVLESTSPPRTTVDLVRPILERSGLRAGEDFLLAYSPERVLPGRILEELVENARVIGGINPASAEAGRDLYLAFVQGEISLTDATTAEMVKLMENTYRDVNIALANEFALVAEQTGVDVWQAMHIANHHPRVHILQPGPGVGGHCIAVDPWFIVQAAPASTPLIQAGRKVNDAMPRHVVGLVKRAVEGCEQPVIACLGLTYKANVDDIRQSPAVEVVRMLQEEGFQVRAYDPYAGARVLPCQVASLLDAVTGSDCLVILTDHRAFDSLSPGQIGPLMRTKIVVDTRNCLAHEAWLEDGFQSILLGKS